MTIWDVKLYTLSIAQVFPVRTYVQKMANGPVYNFTVGHFQYEYVRRPVVS